MLFNQTTSLTKSIIHSVHTTHKRFHHTATAHSETSKQPKPSITATVSSQLDWRKQYTERIRQKYPARRVHKETLSTDQPKYVRQHKKSYYSQKPQFYIKLRLDGHNRKDRPQMTWPEVANKDLKELGMCKTSTFHRTMWKLLICKCSAGGLLGSWSLQDECLVPAHPNVPEKVP